MWKESSVHICLGAKFLHDRIDQRYPIAIYSLSWDVCKKPNFSLFIQSLGFGNDLFQQQAWFTLSRHLSKYVTNLFGTLARPWTLRRNQSSSNSDRSTITLALVALSTTRPEHEPSIKHCEHHWEQQRSWALRSTRPWESAFLPEWDWMKGNTPCSNLQDQLLKILWSYEEVYEILWIPFKKFLNFPPHFPSSARPGIQKI